MTELSPDLISAYLDDECTPEERAAVEARLVTDPAWAAELDEVRAARDAVRGLPLVAVPPGCWESVAAAIAAADDQAGDESATVVPMRRHRVRTALYATAATAAASVAAVVALVFITEPPESDQPVRPAVALLANTHGARVTAMDEPLTRVATASVLVPTSESGR
jgi:anti-sigma factor RsiW